MSDLNAKAKSLNIALLLLCFLASPVFAQDVGVDVAPAGDEKIVEANLTDASADIEGEIDADLYFDADSLIPDLPQGELSAEAAPKRLDPVLEPASKFIVVDKNHDKASIQARLVAADRAIKLGRYAAAVEIYTQLKAKHPTNPAVLLGYAVSLQHTGRSEEAIDGYEALLDVDPENLDAHVNMLGLVSESYPSVALQRLMSLKNKNESHVPLLAQLAYVQARLGRNEEALKSFALASSIEPHNPNHFMSMAIVADSAGMIAEAIEYYEKALDTDTIYGGGRSIPREEIFDRLANLR